MHRKRWGGWYYRVLAEGYVEQNLPLVLLDRLFPQWTVTQAYEIMADRHSDPKVIAELAGCPLLSVGWREYLYARALASEG